MTDEECAIDFLQRNDIPYKHTLLEMLTMTDEKDLKIAELEGRIQELQRIVEAQLQPKIVCPACKGYGTSGSPICTCWKCNGTGRI